MERSESITSDDGGIFHAISTHSESTFPRGREIYDMAPPLPRRATSPSCSLMIFTDLRGRMMFSHAVSSTDSFSRKNTTLTALQIDPTAPGTLIRAG